MSDFSRCRQLLQSAGLLCLLEEAGPPAPALYLVGGAVRDALLGNPLKDLDFVAATDPTRLARSFAARTGGHWFWLDRQRLYSRVVFNLQGWQLESDFTPFRGADLTQDLLLRDFTINAMALRIHPWDEALIDPLGGMADLRSGRLRHCYESAFSDDPLRVLRGVRIASQTGFSLCDTTLALMRESARASYGVAPERTTAELVLSLAASPLSKLFERLCDAGLDQLFAATAPPSVSPRLIRWDRDLSSVRESAPGIFDVLDHPLGAGINRLVLLKLFLLLTAWDGCQGLPPYLCLPAKCRKLLALMGELYGKSPAWDDLWGISQRASLRRLADWQPDPPSLLLLHWLLCGGQPHRLEDVGRLLAEFAIQAPQGRLPELVGSEWLRHKLSVASGAGFGKALKALHQAELAGRVKDQEGAEEFLLGEFQKDVDKG